MTALKAQRIERPFTPPPAPIVAKPAPKPKTKKPETPYATISASVVEEAAATHVEINEATMTPRMRLDGNDSYQHVCILLGYDPGTWHDLVMSSNRHPNVVMIRQFWALRLYVWHGYSFPEISVIMGRATHSSMIAMVERIGKNAKLCKMAMRIMGMEWPEETV